METNEATKKVVIVEDEKKSGVDNWSPEKKKDFFDTLALGASRYGGGNGKTICQVTPCDRQ